MIWLRHELWETHDGPSYGLASRAETERRAAGPAKATLQQVFYAPSPAAAEAIYRALRLLGPYTPEGPEAEAPFTTAQLTAQLADFPDDAYLASQSPSPSGPVHDDAHTLPDAADPLADADEGADQGHEDHALSGPGQVEVERGFPHLDPATGEPTVAESHGPAPAEEGPWTAEPPGTETSDESSLGPVSHLPLTASRRISRSRSNPLVAFLRTLLLLILVAAIALGLGLITGALDGPTVLAEAQKTTAAALDGSLWETLKAKLGF